MNAATASKSLPSELAYGDVTPASGGHKGTLVPPPLQRQENAQLQLWWAAATAACCSHLGLPCELGQTMQSLLDDSSMADVAISLQGAEDCVWAHAAIVAAHCPKLYQTIIKQQQHQRHAVDNDSADSNIMRLQLGRQVKASTMKQVLEYLYTGQVKILATGDDRLALRKLAHALELPQLVALAAALRPIPGASYEPLSLRSIAPSKPFALTWKAALPHSSDLLLAQLEWQPQGFTWTDTSHKGAFRTTGKGVDAQQVTELPPLADDRRHPELHDLLGSSLNVQIPARMLRPHQIMQHFDLMLVPLHADSSKSAVLHQGASQNDSAISTSGAATLSNNIADESAHQLNLWALPAHRAVVAATSPYFAAMLSDRWQAENALSCCNKQMAVAHLPSHDMDVVLAFVCFCYTRELALNPWACAALDNLPKTTGNELCGKCWQSRTAVRLSAAAEAWMVPQLLERCQQFVSDSLPSLPMGCQEAVHKDMSELQTQDLAQHLAVL